MIKRKVSSQGFELDYNVPESVDEYNNLAPKRENAVLEDAVQNVLYRGVFNKFRAQLVEKLAEQTGVAVINHGTEDEPKYESEGAYMKRLIAVVAQQRGLDPAAKSTRDKLLAEWTPLAQSIIDGIPFDPSEKESSGEGKAIVGKGDLEMAGKAIAEGKGEKLATLLASALGRAIAFDPNGDGEANKKSLAVALKDRRQKLAKELEERTKAELAGV